MKSLHSLLNIDDLSLRMERAGYFEDYRAKTKVMITGLVCTHANNDVLDMC